MPLLLYVVLALILASLCNQWDLDALGLSAAMRRILSTLHSLGSDFLVLYRVSVLATFLPRMDHFDAANRSRCEVKMSDATPDSLGVVSMKKSLAIREKCTES